MTISTDAKSAKPTDAWNPDRLQIGRAQIDSLYRRAMQGDAAAAKDLVDLARYAAIKLKLIWDGLDLDTPSPDFEKNRKPLRKILRSIATQQETWPIEFHCRTKKRESTALMLKELALGTKTPLKAVGVKDSYMRHLIETLCYELGYPSAHNRRSWIDSAMHYVERNFPEPLRQDTWLRALADPERQIGKRQAKAYKKLEAWERKAKQGHRSGKLSVEELEEKKKRTQRIKANASVTEAELIFGLREALTAAVKSLVHERPQI